jgi:small subunit ribosomal protein S17
MPSTPSTHFRTLKRTVGVVVGTAMDRTAVVAVSRLYVHPKTSKIMRHVSRVFCHDEHEVCAVGDYVQVKAWGRISKKKNAVVVDIVRRAPQVDGEPFPMSRLTVPPSPADIAEVDAIMEGRRVAELEAARALLATPSALPLPPDALPPKKALRDLKAFENAGPAGEAVAFAQDEGNDAFIEQVAKGRELK